MKLRWLLTSFAFMLLPLHANAASLGISPGSAEFITGCTNSASIIIDTEGQNTLASDAFIQYNPNEIEIVDYNSGIPGVQIGIGNTYETYPGNQVSGGMIRLTGFNRAGFFNGRGVLGKIKLRGKPGVRASSINFQFSPGSSTDSNIADANSNDILSKTTGATFFFKEGECPKPAAPPKKPVEIDTTLQELEDCRSTLGALEEYYKNGKKDYEETLCPALKPVAPPRLGSGLLLWLLILLALSLLLNIDMLVRPENHILNAIPFVKKPIKKEKSNFKTRKIRKKHQR